MRNCPQSECSWQAIAPSADGARNAYLRHVVEEHAGGPDAVDVVWFEKDPGETSNRRSHGHERVFIVLDGVLVLHTDEDSVELSTSDSMLVAAGEQYHVENPGNRPCVGITTSAPGRGSATGTR